MHSVTYQRRCSCCDERVGTGATAQCHALQLLATLEDDMRERDMLIQHDLDQDEEGIVDLAVLHRSARWYMYRTYVASQYGHLGPGIRVRIPPCVVGAIRSRYPAPGCTCTTIDALMSCTCCDAHTGRHCYKGHRDV